MNGLQCQDEILQMMYWMRGEQVGDQVTASQLNRFLGIEELELRSALDQLIIRGLVTVQSDRFELSERGVGEAAYRFHDEFSSVLGREDHLSCGDPACDCQSGEPDSTCSAAADRR